LRERATVEKIPGRWTIGQAAKTDRFDKNEL
jgi:hypothetical protein